MTDELFNKIFPFNKPRDGQRELIERIISAYDSGKKHIILNAPTGWGKSVIAYSILKYFNDGYVLTSQKCLQEQYYKDLNIPYILGKSNYSCKKNSVLNCSMGVCKNVWENGCKLNCTYRLQKDMAFSSPITNMNYNYFLAINSSISNNRDGIGIQQRNILVLDECHNVENELIKICQLQLSDNIFHDLGMQIHIPDVNATEDNIFVWLFNNVVPRLREQYIYYRTQIIQYNAFKISREFKKVAYRLDIIGRFLTMIKEIANQRELKQKIIITFSNDMIEFKLLYANNLFKTYIESCSNKFLHMSATILDKKDYCKNLGLKESETEYISVDAIFPIENRLIHYLPVGSLAYKNKQETMPKLITKVEEIMKKYKNTKGIIHTGNYNIAENIMNSLSYTEMGERLIMPRGSNRQEVLNKFYNSSLPYVLISPSLTEGLDLKDDLSRFCIICKIPYMNLGDSWVKARMEARQQWYTINAAQTLVQMTGRSIRSETDYCDTYILDENFISFAQMAFNILPDWWKNSVIDT
jgi:Rad3-related DNA helicase